MGDGKRASRPPAGAPRLLDRVRSEVGLRHYSRRTEEAYVAWIRRFILFHGKRHPAMLDGEQVAQFLTHLAREKRVAGSTQNRALNAIVFLYQRVLRQDVEGIERFVRAHRARRLPVVLSPDEVARVLGRISGTPRLVASLLYGSGLRLLECLRLRVKDLDFEIREIRLREAQGRKDRVVPLPEARLAPLRDHLVEVRAVFERDLRDGSGGVALPDALERKYRGSSREWG